MASCPDQSTTNNKADTYGLGYDEAERLRLLTQCDFLRPSAEWLLDAIGVQPGRRVLDVGCGPLGILDLLAKRAESSQVVGIERSPEYIAAARRSLDERGFTDVRLVQADAAGTGLPSESFDLTHARFLLINVPQPDAVVREMARLTCPQGIVVYQEFDLAL